MSRFKKPSHAIYRCTYHISMDTKISLPHTRGSYQRIVVQGYPHAFGMERLCYYGDEYIKGSYSSFRKLSPKDFHIHIDRETLRGKLRSNF